MKTQEMTAQDYTTSITVDATVQEAFSAVDNVSNWWSSHFEGQSEKLNDVFTVHFGKTWITVEIVEHIPFKKIHWYVTDCYKDYLEDKKEWKDTEMIWEISAKKNATTIGFTHIGLVPDKVCYGGCAKAWDYYVKESLLKFLKEGKGMPE